MGSILNICARHDVGKRSTRTAARVRPTEKANKPSSAVGGDHITFQADHLGNLDNATLTMVMGIVHLKTSCNEVAQRRFDRAMRYQHSFWYRQPRELLEEMLKAELSEGQARIFWPINSVAPECDFGLWNCFGARPQPSCYPAPSQIQRGSPRCTFPALPDTLNPYSARSEQGTA